MPVTQTWDVQKIESYPTTQNQAGVTTTVHWTLNATDGTRSAASYGSAVITAQVNTGQFTAFDNLTKSQVLNWVYAVLGDEKAAAEADLAKRIATLASPPSVRNGVPW